jgi:hypothetical protein
MTQVVLHYAHTFQICMFNFQFQFCFVVQFKQAYLKKLVRHRNENFAQRLESMTGRATAI